MRTHESRTCIANKEVRIPLAGLILSLIWPGLSHASDSSAIIEEVLVTGTYLQKSSEDSPSPLSVVTAADIADIGAADVAEIVQTMPWQSGSQTRATTFSGEGADGRASINLRNLGHGATLVLVNGKRHVPSWYNGRGNASVNVNALIPNIAIQRVEIVKDGAAAIYGSDAIAGVVNFITDTTFEGLDVEYQFTTDDETGKGDANRVQVKWGMQGARGGIVATAGILRRKEITIGDRAERFSGSSASGTGQPGRFAPLPTDIDGNPQQIIWASHGLNPGQPAGSLFAPPRDPLGTTFGQADPDCETIAATDGEGGTIGPVFGNLICAFDFGSFFALQASETLRQLNVDGTFEIAQNLETYFELSANGSRFERDNSLNPNSPSLRIQSSHPGLIEDAFRRGIEPVDVANITRAVGQTADDPTRPVKTFTNTNRTDLRFVIGGVLDLNFADRAWTVDASYTASDHTSNTAQVQDTLSSHIELALNGLGGPSCDPFTGVPGEGNQAFAASGGDFTAGQCFFFNPFGNARVDRDGGSQSDLTLANPEELIEWMLGRASSDEEYRQRVIEVIASGRVVDLPAGPIQLAVGYQRRRDTGELIVDSALASNNLDFAFGAQDWNGELTTNSVFGEIAVPLHRMVDFNAALRFESFDEINEDTVDPKFTVMFRPLESVTIRGSYGSSFRVPSLLQLFGTLTTVANEVDFDGVAAFRPAISPGSIDLRPEQADTFNVGLSWIPREGLLEGLRFDLDYFDYEYDDIITRQDPSDLLAVDNAAINAFLATNPGTGAGDAVNAGVGLRDQVIRNAEGRLVRTLPLFENANQADVNGLDLTTSYRIDSRLGQWRLGFQGSWMRTYDLEIVNAAGDVETIDAVGFYNPDNPVARPLPEWKVTGSIGWTWRNHSAFVLVQHTPELEFGLDLETDGGAAASARFWRQTVALVHGQETAEKFFTETIDSFTPVNVSYTYDFGQRGVLAGSRITLGINNIANEGPPWVPVNTGFDATLHDARGRIWYTRLSANL